MKQLLDNIVWHTLSGPHARFASGADEVRRYARGFSPIIGFADPARPRLDALREFCADDEHFYCDGWGGPAPAGWCIDAESAMYKMIWEAEIPAPVDHLAEGLRCASLNAADATQALALATLTKPGPFGSRTIELGEYIGFFDGERLVAMAGERMHAGRLREISGVCTHPDFQGRGLARQLMQTLIRHQMQRGETPFLHVMRENGNAHKLYQRMGFADYKEAVVRVISLCL